MKFTNYDLGVILTSIMFLFNSFLAPITISSVLHFLAGYFIVWGLLSIIITGGPLRRALRLNSYDVAVCVCAFIFGIASLFSPLTPVFFLGYGLTYAFLTFFIARSKS